MEAKKPHGPRPLADVLGKVLAKYDIAGTTARLDLERGWLAAIGPELAPRARVGALRRGTLEVHVDSSALLQELAGYRKEELLATLRANLRHSVVTALRFRRGE